MKGSQRAVGGRSRNRGDETFFQIFSRYPAVGLECREPDRCYVVIGVGFAGGDRCVNRSNVMNLRRDLMINRPARIGVLGAAALFGLAVSVAPLFAAGGSEPESRYPPPPTTTPPKGDQSTSTKKKSDKKSEQEFLDGYRAARALVLDGRYDEGIAAFRALGEDDHPDVANYIGYAERKLGHYQASKVWYEKALAANPNHLRTWQYYGMWHVEQGNMLKAQDFLEKIRLICGNTSCQEYRDLKGAMEGTVSY
jgi:tetratricopeptide (TPR) repeat protein